MFTPFAFVSSIAVRIQNAGSICICGAGWGFCSCSWFLRLPCACGMGVVPASGWGVANALLRGATGRGRGISGGANPPGRATISGWKFPVARAFLRISKFGHRTLCCLSNSWRNLLLNSCFISQRRAAGKVGLWRACTLSLKMTSDVSSRRRNISTYRAKDGPISELGRCLIIACDGGGGLLSHQQTSAGDLRCRKWRPQPGGTGQMLLKTVAPETCSVTI